MRDSCDRELFVSVLGREEDMFGTELREELRACEAVHDRAFDLGEMKLDAGVSQPGQMSRSGSLSRVRAFRVCGEGGVALML